MPMAEAKMETTPSKVGTPWMALGETAVLTVFCIIDLRYMCRYTWKRNTIQYNTIPYNTMQYNTHLQPVIPKFGLGKICMSFCGPGLHRCCEFFDVLPSPSSVHR